MALYLPGFTGLLAVAIAWGVAVVLLLMGTAAGGRNATPEVRLISGWGALCIVLTLWGIFVPASLRVPTVAIVIAALAAQLVPSRRVGRQDVAALGRLLLLTLP